MNDRDFKKIEDHKKELKEWAAENTTQTPAETYERILSHTLEKIKFLERIYTTGGLEFSDELTKAAKQERDALCLQSTALYSLLREIKKD